MAPINSIVAIFCILVVLPLLESCASSAPKAQDWRGVGFRQFLSMRTDATGSGIAAEHAATGARVLSYVVGEERYSKSRQNPVDLLIWDFRTWCVENGGVFSSQSPEVERAVSSLNSERGQRPTTYTGHECRGPVPVGIIRYDVNGRTYQYGADQKTVLLLYAENDWKQFLESYVNIDQKRRQAIVQKVQVASQDRDIRTRELRSNPRVGDKTSQGMIVDVRPPLVLIQYNESVRKLFNKPQVEWVKVDSIEAPSRN